MRSALLRSVLSFLLAVGVGTMTIGHRDNAIAPVEGGQLEAHHHGPHAPCPEGDETHCLACAAFALFAPAPSLGRIAIPVSFRAGWTSAKGENRSADRPAPSGRSPPGPLPIG